MACCGIYSTLATLLVLVLAYLVSSSSAAGVVCRDDNGNPVDWWYAVKYPRNSSQTDPQIVYGDAYAYILSSETVNTWTVSPLGTDNATSMMGRTLAPVYAQPRDPNLMYILYNDENPDGNTTYGLGHTKGDLVADQDGGYWLIHSVPKYPSWDNTPYGYPSSGHMYGQNFLCITIPLTEVDKIGKQFQYSLPWVFNQAIPSWAVTQFPNLYDAIVNGVHPTAAPYYHIVDLQSQGGAVFKSFAKHTNFNQDIYADLVAPTIQSNLWVETWNHGSDQLPSVCGQYEVKNIEEVRADPLSYVYTTGNDHSKYAVAPATDAQPWICSGDNNRMGSQEVRGGTQTCFNNARVWNAFSSMITAVQPCV